MTHTYTAVHHIAELAVADADARSYLSAPEPCDPEYIQAARDAARDAAQHADTTANVMPANSPMRTLWAAIAASWRAVQHADTVQQMRAGSNAAFTLLDAMAG